MPFIGFFLGVYAMQVSFQSHTEDLRTDLTYPSPSHIQYFTVIIFGNRGRAAIAVYILDCVLRYS
jgi:hypothetical protein